MQTIKIILLLLCFAAVSCNSQKNVQTAEDVLRENNVSRVGKFESKEGSFKVDFPCEPLKSEIPIESNYGNQKMTVFECGNEIARFSVSFQDFTKKINNPKQVFEEQKKMRLDGMEDIAKVVLETEKKINDFPAVYFETEQNANEMFPKSGLFNELQLLKGQRFYSVFTTVLGKEGQSPKDIGKEIKDKTKEFIDSFEIIAHN